MLLGLRRVEMRLPLRPGTTAAYVSRSFDRDAALYLRTVGSQCELALAAPVYFIRPCDLELSFGCDGLRCLLAVEISGSAALAL